MSFNYDNIRGSVKDNKNKYLIYIDNFEDEIHIENRKITSVGFKIKDVDSGVIYKSINQASTDLKISWNKLKSMLEGNSINTTSLVFFKDYIEDKYKNGIEDIRLITWDISEGGFDAVENYDSSSGQEMWDLQIDVEEEIKKDPEEPEKK